MFRFFKPALLLTCGALAACIQTSEPLRYPVPVVQAQEKVRISYGLVEVREVSLPDYAQLAEMAVENSTGGIRTVKKNLWADNPVRSVTLELSRNLGLITGATVASEPWPFESIPGVRVEVRIEEMLSNRQDQFVLSGLYYVSSTDGSGRSRSRVFNLTEQMAPGAGPTEIAAARGQIIHQLALLIAKDGLR